MPSARILPFASSVRLRLQPDATVRLVLAPRPACRPEGFGPLLVVTLLLAFLYLTRVAEEARHDGLYGAALAAVWGFYFFHDRLLRVRVLGPLATLAGRLLPPAAVVSFFGFVLWLVLSHP